MDDCLFCKIVKKEIPAQIVYEDDKIMAFKDINPAAPVHILLIPKKHIPDLTALEPVDAEVIGHLHLVAKQIAEEQGVAESGFRLLNNCKEDGGQVIYHLHFHLIGGRKLTHLC
ncbi:histidine triad nucleotide-binding protein [Zhaonella formicivorans]|uniref:histidine triad nucleotide-binding protein n=1 Tax=Zhaonella formicivorans TaxID=2528593 RepID=UPI0010E91626|nr:histidine triad nucleotide-binding protein [Zhaonella formicivorans]